MGKHGVIGSSLRNQNQKPTFVLLLPPSSQDSPAERLQESIIRSDLEEMFGSVLEDEQMETQQRIVQRDESLHEHSILAKSAALNCSEGVGSSVSS